jgi:survival motor neuron protein
MSNFTLKYLLQKEHDEIWDDTLLIQAYEESIRLQKEEVAKELAMKTNSKRKSSENSESSSSSLNPVENFKAGDFVRSTFEDGVDYEAEILSINENGNALIRYIGYGNEERVKLEDLVASWGLEAREEQKLLAEADNPTNEHQEGLHQFVLNKTSGMSGKLPIPPMVRKLNHFRGWI